MDLGEMLDGYEKKETVDAVKEYYANKTKKPVYRKD